VLLFFRETLRMAIRCVAMAEVTIVTGILAVTFRQVSGAASRFHLKVGIIAAPCPGFPTVVSGVA